MAEQRNVTEQEVAQAILNRIDRLLASWRDGADGVGVEAERLANAYAKLVYVPNDCHRSVDLRGPRT